MADHNGESGLCACVLGTRATAKLVPETLDGRPVAVQTCTDGPGLMRLMAQRVPDVVLMDARHADRTEERRVGKECRSRGPPDH